VQEVSRENFVQREQRFAVERAKGFDVLVCRGESSDMVFYADLMDFSRSGLKFCLPFNARFDEKLQIQLTFKDYEFSYSGTSRVRHIRNKEVNRWVVGCSVSPELPDEVVDALADLTEQERRKSPRSKVEGKGYLSRQGEVEEIPATIKNVSTGGFCLRVDEEFEVGSQVNFSMENRFGFQEQIDARVCWQRESEGEQLIGLSFADRAAHERLLDCFEFPHTDEAESILFGNWKVVALAMTAILMPTLFYLLVGTNFGSTNNEVSKTQNTRSADVQLAPTSPEVPNRPTVAFVEPINRADKTNALMQAGAARKDKRPNRIPAELTTRHKVQTRRLRFTPYNGPGSTSESSMGNIGISDSQRIGLVNTKSATSATSHELEKSSRRGSGHFSLHVPSEPIQ